MTIVVRDEADILDANLAFHLNAGVDLVIAADDTSSDGTTEILEAYAREGFVHLIRQTGNEVLQMQWTTEMARSAATDFGADWVINADADEFWWPRGGDLKDVLRAVPARFGIVCAMWRNFAPRPADHPFFAERMTVRLSPRSPLLERNNPFWIERKVAHRADPHIHVGHGSHDVASDHLRLLRTWLPIEVLHFPVRTPEQATRKWTSAYERRPAEGVERAGPHQEKAYQRVRAGQEAQLYESLVIDDASLEAAISAGTVAIDTRLRDVLRVLRLASEAEGRRQDFRVPRPGEARLPLPQSGTDEAFVDDVSALAERDSLEKAHVRVQLLEKRLAALERARVVALADRVRMLKAGVATPFRR